MNNKLYGEFASYYAAVTQDRDFSSQIKCIIDDYPKKYRCRNLLELFAGNALHSIAAEKMGVDVWAIDSSNEMKDLAMKGGFHKYNQYIVGELPKTLLAMNGRIKFDCIICLFHGLSNLSKLAVYNLFINIKNLLSLNGKIFIEIHDIKNIMNYINQPTIVWNEISDVYGSKIKYAWPSGKIIWSHKSFYAEVPVKIVVDSEQGDVIYEFISKEYIHCYEDIAFLARLLGFKFKLLTSLSNWKSNFNMSVVLELYI